jgi:hypothetical protein
MADGVGVRETDRIVDAELLIERYGDWPTFHDAEVIRLELRRDSVCLELDLLTQDRKPDLIVRLIFDGVWDVELGGFNHQNALLGLFVQPENGDSLSIRLDSAHGIGGSFRCLTVRVASIRDHA